MDRQIRYVYDNMTLALETTGSAISRVMQIDSFHMNPAEIDPALRVRKEYFGVETPPPSILLLVSETPVEGATVTCDVIALATDAKQDRVAFETSSAKTPQSTINLIFGQRIFVQAVRGGGFIFTQGKGPSREGAIAEEVFRHPDFPYRDNQIKLQTEIILDYFKSLLEAENATLEHVLKAEVCLRNMEDIAGMDEVWRTYFPTDPPARTIIPASLAGPPEMLIEVQLIAIDPSGPYRKEVISPPDMAPPVGQQSHAVKAGPFLFFSEQMATDYRHGMAPEALPDAAFPYHSSGIKRQVKYIINNVETICRLGGTSIQNLVRRRAIHSDFSELCEAEEVWTETLGERLPPTTTVRATNPLTVPSCTVQYDLIAFVPND